jgi:hypothetical protein
MDERRAGRKRRYISFNDRFILLLKYTVMQPIQHCGTHFPRKPRRNY